MDPVQFFAGMQALAAFLQVWQTERNSSKASKAYFEAKQKALDDPETQTKALRLRSDIENHPTLGLLLKNRIGRCEDAFEQALRFGKDSLIAEAAKEFVKCKCRVLEAIRIAQSGLSSDLEQQWQNYNCPAVLS